MFTLFQEKKRRLIAVGMILLFVNSYSYAQTFVLDKNFTLEAIEKGCSILEDPTGKLPFEQIRKQKFKPHTLSYFLFPYTSSAYWIKFDVKANFAETKNWYFIWDNAQGEHVDFYLPNSDGSYSVVNEGSNVYKPQNKFIKNIVYVPFSTIDSLKHTYYIRIESQRAFLATFRVASPSGLAMFKNDKSKKEGFINGLLILRLFYVLFLSFFVIKGDKLFKTYSVFLLCQTLAYLAFMGILGLLFSKNMHVAHVINQVVYFSIAIPNLWVLYLLIDWGRYKKHIRAIFRTFTLLNALFCIGIVFDYHWYWLKAANYIHFIADFFAFFFILISLIMKRRIEWPCVVPYLMAILSGLYIPLRLIGFKTFPGSYEISGFLFILEIFVFGIFLGKIIQNYENKKNKAEHELDITNARTENLLKMDKMKSNFFTNISHEFKTPLTLVIAPVDDLIKKYPSESVLENIKNNTSRLLELINQLLDVSKLESGEMKLSLETVQLNSFFKRIGGSFQSLAVSKNIEFEITIFKTNQEGKIDADKVEKIVNNLLSNAFKFCQENGKVEFVVEAEEDLLKIWVKDNGIGIEQEEVEHIFDRFYQIDSSHNRKYEGTGIGLTLVEELITAMNGAISVKSEVNKGTAFEVLLPVELSPSLSTEQPPMEDVQTKKSEGGQLMDGLSSPSVGRPNPLPQERTSNHSPFLWRGIGGEVKPTTTDLDNQTSASDKPLLLVVEDNQEIRTYIAQIFAADFQVLEAADGKEGIEVANTEIPDIIISDLMMPEMDGFEFCKKIKANPLSSHVPIIMLTAKDTKLSRLESYRLGIDHFISKPFDNDVLLSIVNSILENRKILQETYRNLDTLSFKKRIEKEVPFLSEFSTYLEKHYAEPGLNLTKIADNFNLSEKQFTRKIKALSGTTPIDLLRKYRLNLAAKWLLESNHSIAEIAHSVGYENPSYFSKLFLTEFGISPSKYGKRQS